MKRGHTEAEGESVPPRRTILIADDEPQLRLLVRLTISSDEYAVLEAADGAAAWQLIQERQPAVVLLDVEMPPPDGFALTRAIKSDPALASTYVILLTGRASDADLAAGQAVGADRYLTKPFSPLELLTTLEQALAGHRCPAP